MALQRIGVIFGGRSVEHEISILSAHQVLAALPPELYEGIPLYISKEGRWYSGEVLKNLKAFADLDALTRAAEPVVFNPDASAPGPLLMPMHERRGLFGGRSGPSRRLPIDLAFPVLHGAHGEDGTLQGLFELADLPYVGSSVMSSAIGMDKIAAKILLRAAGLPVVEHLEVRRSRWRSEPDQCIAEVEAGFGYPVFVKPVSLGSSIGVAQAKDRAGLRFALDVAATYDSRAMVEPAQQEIIEINCAVLGQGDETRASVLEQPLGGDLLSYEDKYLRGGKSEGMKSTRRLIPAPLEPDLTRMIQSAARRTFSAIGAAGVARVDFLVRPQDNTFLVNEINTMPGSLSFYLWEPAGLPFGELVTQLIEMAHERHEEKGRSTFSFDSSVLAGAALGGSKGPSGAKSPASDGWIHGDQATISPPPAPASLRS